MKYLIIPILCLALTACAGQTIYKVTTPSGIIVEAINSKDYESFEMIVTKGENGEYSFKMVETGVSASSPMKALQEQILRLVIPTL